MAEVPNPAFLTRRCFQSRCRPGDRRRVLCQEVVTGRSARSASGCMGATFMPFAMPGASVQIVHRASGIAIFQFSGPAGGRASTPSRRGV